MKSFGFLICIVLASMAQPSVEETTHKTLKVLHIIFRHGDRYPISQHNIYEPNSNLSYPSGQLTENGKNRSFLLGQWLRKRYGTFLGSYSTDKVKSFNTNVERTRATLHRVLKGLFPILNDNDNLDSDIQDLWEKDTTLPSNNTVLVLPNKECVNYYTFYKEYIKTETNQNVLKKYIQLADIMEKNLNRNFTTLNDIFRVCDDFLVQKEIGLSIPQWIDKLLPELKPVVMDYFLSTTATKDLKSILAGEFIKYVIKVSDLKFKNQLQPENRKLFLYSSHEYNIHSVLQLLNHTSEDRPPYSSCVMIEGHTVENEEGFKVFYKDGFKDDVFAIPIPECGLFCPLSKFLTIFEKYFHSYKIC